MLCVRMIANSRSAVICPRIESPRVNAQVSPVRKSLFQASPKNGNVAFSEHSLCNDRRAVRCLAQQSRRRRYSPDERGLNSRKACNGDA